jgi:hypothetical protein
MGLLETSAGMLRTVARIASVSSIRATTDTPAAKIELSYNHHGQEHKSAFTLEELLSVFTEQATDARTPVPPGYTDLADVP